MIKETVDAVRLAELEADKIIRTAEEDAQDRKSQIKTQAQDYRINSLNEAKDIAEKEMVSTVNKCKAYEEEAGKEIQIKISDLKTVAEKRMDAAVEAVINALVQTDAD